MRIRKRKVPLPLSLLSPIPISDPHLFSRSPVFLVQGSAEEDETITPAADIITTTGKNSLQPSDHLTYSDLHRLIDDGNSSSDHHHLHHDDHDHDHDRVVKSDSQLLGCLGIGGVESMPKCNNNDASNKSITALGAAADYGNGPSLPSPNHAERMRWYDEDKAMPLKKRRSSLDNNKALVSKQSRIDVDASNNDNNNSSSLSVSVKKASKRGNTIMEGSRCSRVNGRGWRCCQPTLVGYSLCEHHLGKGRLRSMTGSSNGGARGRPSSSKKAALGMTTSDTTLSPLMQLCEAAKKESENKADAAITTMNSSTSSVGKRVKVGVVKARSLSSLLEKITDTTSSSGSGSMISMATQEYENNNESASTYS